MVQYIWEENYNYIIFIIHLMISKLHNIITGSLIIKNEEFISYPYIKLRTIQMKVMI